MGKTTGTVSLYIFLSLVLAYTSHVNTIPQDTNSQNTTKQSKMGSLAPSSSRLFEPLRMGTMDLHHRLVMAPLTRFRAEEDTHVPLPFVSTYYAQRAAVPGTLLIPEATFISHRAAGYANVPGIYSRAQIEAWKSITSAVHAKGSYIYCQLWALGRTADAANAKAEGIEIVSSSANALDSAHAVPKEMTRDDIKQFVSDYAQAARNSPRTPATPAPTSTAAASRTAPASAWRSPAPSSMPSVLIRSAFVSRHSRASRA